MTTEETPRPKPAPPKPRPKPGESQEVGALREKINRPTPVKEKPKFVRKPHLTARPFKDNEELAKLQKSMENTTKKSTPRRGQRRNNKESK